jgi:hypothetical protein
MRRTRPFERSIAPYPVVRKAGSIPRMRSAAFLRVAASRSR